ncbi:L,D-transpeptidase family protein [Phenylobacterium sp.]|uniref:L,D-transpeptidase family protein n=1 Tax=Phenylobacterium sp. TaxID=1871053 RepID=UPI002B57B5C9|nr:L,D-transpeptidase family protein [Phenylobacterium sp.]HVI30568.1 L,D-transpeptidase family protein [Phenylobacterium sp.]
MKTRRINRALRLQGAQRRLAALAAVVLALAAVWAVLSVAPAYALRAALRAELAASAPPEGVAAFYAARGYRPVWVEATGVWPFAMHARLLPAARERARIAVAAGALDPGSQTLRDRASAALRRPDLGPLREAARAEFALSASLAAHAEAVAGARTRELAFVDPLFPPAPPPDEFLQWAAFAPSAVGDVGRLNPVYDQLAEGLVAYRREWSQLPQMETPGGPLLRPGDRGARVRILRARLGLPEGDEFDDALAQALSRFQAVHGIPVSGSGDGATLAALNRGAAHYERLIRANLERARGLPPPLTERFILVNPAAGRLWLYEGGRVVDTMRVIVGSRREQTPNMVGLIRYMVYNPYWEIPVDIAREAIAPVAARLGPGYVRARNMQVLSDWSDTARVVSADSVNWSAVAAGRTEVRLRQAPGPTNMMGSLKFMMPNELGIYLHDTPDKILFGSDARQISAGCVRVERANDLAAWIRMERPVNPAFHGLDQTVEQFSPVTVYITYLTAAPSVEGVRFYPDVYGRDRSAGMGVTPRSRA